jgi:hypothetical protein
MSPPLHALPDEAPCFDRWAGPSYSALLQDLISLIVMLPADGAVHGEILTHGSLGGCARVPFSVCRAEGVVPQVHVSEPVLRFPSVFIGSTHTQPLTLVNTTPVAATLMCDLMQKPEFELHLSRDAWADAGYAACPVKRIGANGEMSAVGSTRGSRR